MKSFQQLAVVVIFAALGSGGLRAQSIDVKATIPFDFHAGNALMPAGEYLIHGEGPVVFLRTADGRTQAPILLSMGISDRHASGVAAVDFNRYGRQYFLTAIWDSSSQHGGQMLKTSREKELAQRGDVPLPIEVTVASRK